MKDDRILGKMLGSFLESIFRTTPYKEKAPLDEYLRCTKPGKPALRCFAPLISWEIHHGRPEP
jgi:hypothetical protein